MTICHVKQEDKKSWFSNLVLSVGLKKRSVGGGAFCQEHDCKQLCKMIGNSFASVSFMRLEAERSVAERGFQKRRAAQSSREIRRLSSCSVRRSISAIL